MDELAINWSAVLRERIREEVDGTAGRDLARAVLFTERLRRPVEGWDSTDELRHWRDRRGRR